MFTTWKRDLAIVAILWLAAASAWAGYQHWVFYARVNGSLQVGLLSRLPSTVRDLRSEYKVGRGGATCSISFSADPETVKSFIADSPCLSGSRPVSFISPGPDKLHLVEANVLQANQITLP